MTNAGGANATISVAKPDDEDTSYITIVAGIDTTCLYDVTDTAIPGNATINSVLVRARIKSTLGTDNSGAVDMSDNAFTNTVTSSPLITTSYADFVGTTSATAPSGGAWTVAKLNSLQVRVKGYDVTIARVTTLTVEVTWTAASGHNNLCLIGVG